MASRDFFQLWDNPPSDAPKNWYQQRGYALEKLIHQVLNREKLEPKASFRPDGEEIDGSFIFGDRTFLLEAKWRSGTIPASDLYAFKGKVDGKLAGTLGVFISMSGYSPDAVDALSAGKDINLILFTGADFRLVAENRITFREALKQKLRHAAEFGQPYLPLASGANTEPASVAPDVEILGTRAKRSRSANISPHPNSSKRWNLVVESEFDQLALNILLNRFEIPHSGFRTWVAGGTLAVPGLVKKLDSSGYSKIIALLDRSVIAAEELAELNAVLNGSDRLLVLFDPDVLTWLLAANPGMPKSNSLSRATAEFIRRAAAKADLEMLRATNPIFEAAIRQMVGDI